MSGKAWWLMQRIKPWFEPPPRLMKHIYAQYRHGVLLHPCWLNTSESEMLSRTIAANPSLALLGERVPSREDSVE